MTKKKTGKTVELLNQLDVALDILEERRLAHEASVKAETAARRAFEEAKSAAENLQTETQRHMAGLVPAVLDPPRVRQG